MPNETDFLVIEKAHELDALFCNHAPITQFEQFFTSNSENLLEIFRKSICCDNLFSLEFIRAIAIPYVKSICIFLEGKPYIDYSSKMCCCASVIMANGVCCVKKAMFWNVLVTLSYSWSGVPDPFFAQDIFMDNEDARAARVYYQKSDEKRGFIKNTKLFKRIVLDNTFPKGIREDSVSIFEMNRQMAGRNITNTMLQILLHFDAVKCFLHLLAHFPKKVYKCRSADEWLFTVCRNCSPKTAIPIIQYLEEDKPGIVSSTRDPWGNTLLWNTCANRDRRVNEIQKVLIDLGCDPDVENQWGLSFRLVQENKIENGDR